MSDPHPAAGHDADHEEGWGRITAEETDTAAQRLRNRARAPG